MSYDLDEHRHRFSAWAATRAVLRGLSVKSGELVRALEKSGIKEFVNSYRCDSLDDSQFDKKHRIWCEAILESLTNCELSYGRAAKLVAVYLKSSVVLGPASCSALAHVAHPPIDRILLKCLGKKHNKEWVKIVWTRLGKDEYYGLIKELRLLHGPKEPFWKIEECWKPT